MHFDPFLGEVKTNAIFKIFDPKNLDNNEAKILSIWTIAQEAMKANMWPPRGHSPKLLLILKSLTQNYILTPMKQKLRL